MHFQVPTHLPIPGRLGLGSLAFALMISSAFAGLADIETQVLAVRAGPALAPPRYPDAVHVYNGCCLSTSAYLARFRSDFGAEQGQPLVIWLNNEDGNMRPHTVALVSWRGAWWCRDEYFGVIDIHCRVEGTPNLKKITSRLISVFVAHSRKCMLDASMEHPVAAPTELSSRERLEAVAAVGRIVPFATRIFWIGTKSGALPVAFFRPGPRQIAVYDPLFGTAQAECAFADDVKVVALVAERLGYRATYIRAESTSSNGTLVASLGLRR